MTVFRLLGAITSVITVSPLIIGCASAKGGTLVKTVCGRKQKSLLYPPLPVRMNETQSQPAVSEDCKNPPLLGHQCAVTPVSNGFVGFARSKNSVIGFPVMPIKVKVNLKNSSRSSANWKSVTIVNATSQMFRDDLKAVETIKQTNVMNVNQYHMELPWKSQQPLLPNNRALAEHRFKLLRKRLCRDPDLFGKYSSVIDYFLSKGYYEKVPDSSLSRADGMVWYLPHHPVRAPPRETR